MQNSTRCKLWYDMHDPAVSAIELLLMPGKLLWLTDQVVMSLICN